MDDVHADPLRSPGIRPYERELAMLGHLVTRPDLLALTRLLILDAMLLWTPSPRCPRSPPHPHGTPVGRFLRDVRLLLDLSPWTTAPDDHERQILSDVHRMLGLAQYSLVDPAGAHAGQHRWQQQHDHLAGLRAERARRRPPPRPRRAPPPAQRHGR